MASNANRGSASEAAIEYMSVRFTRERMEKTRGTTRVFAVARRDVRGISVQDDSAAEHPRRELFWTIATGAGGVFLLVEAGGSGKTSEWVAGGVLTAIALLLVRNQMKRVTVVEVDTVNGNARISMEGRLGRAELVELRRRLRGELGWPVRE